MKKSEVERSNLAKQTLALLDKAANVVRDELQADVYLYSGPIRAGADTDCIDSINALKTNLKSAVLVLCTNGGSPDVAYRMARAFLRHYKEFSVLINGYCYSAGTLLALGAHEIVLSEHAILGPLDTQIAKTDELFANMSGLTGITALDALRSQAYRSFEQTLVDMKSNFPSELTLKTAIDTALKLTTGLYSPIFAQIDPVKLGEDRRALDIARHYGLRLSKMGRNLKEGALDRLLANYPSHSFVIDRVEAKELFNDIREPSAAEKALLEVAFMPFYSRTPSDDRTCFPLSDAIRPADNKEPAVEPTDPDTTQTKEKSNGKPNSSGSADRRSVKNKG